MGRCIMDFLAMNVTMIVIINNNALCVNTLKLVIDDLSVDIKGVDSVGWCVIFKAEVVQICSFQLNITL